MNSDFYPTARDAVIDKWLTLCKFEFVDEVM